MLGAIIGDIVGSVYEWHNIKTKEFPPCCSHIWDFSPMIQKYITIFCWMSYFRGSFEVEKWIKNCFPKLL